MSRLIVKGLPTRITEEKLRKTFETFGVVTDVSLKYTKDGVFRKFAFVGFENDECSRNAAIKLNNTCFQSSKIQVEECFSFTAENKHRPWSKYAKGSSANKRVFDDNDFNVDYSNSKRHCKENGNFPFKQNSILKKNAKIDKVKIIKDEDANIRKKNVMLKEDILDTGRLFVRNLPYICTDDDLLPLFRKYGEIAELQCIVDITTGKCKGFAIVTFIFPDNAFKAFEELDGTIFKGRMLHILPGKGKIESNLNLKNNRAISKFAFKHESQSKSSFSLSKNCNLLFMGANSTAEVLANRLDLQKRVLLTSDGDNSAAVRLAMAETQLVKDTRDFLLSNNVKLDKKNGHRSNSTIIVKNITPGTDFKKQLTNLFQRFGEVKNIVFSPDSGLSAVVEMGSKVDAQRAFNFIAFSRLKGSDLPLYLEWATVSEIEEEKALSVLNEGTIIDNSKNKQTKILVRNVPFQASLDEVVQLFSAFGEIRDVRLPKKIGIRSVSSHRGFGFIDFVSCVDANRAMDSLMHSTHLYGRRLVLEWAKVDDSVEELRQKSATLLSNRKQSKGTKKEIRDSVENYQILDDNI